MIHYISRIILLCVMHHAFGAQLINCPTNQIRYEKYVGLRPSTVYQGKLLFKGAPSTPVTLTCLSRCYQQPTCASFLLYYNASTCYAFENESINIQNYDYDSRPDTNVVWFRKTCLQVPMSCDSRTWSFEIVSGAVLIGFDTKRIPGTVTRRQCMQYCIGENNFTCRSAKFKVIDPRGDAIGECVLSHVDRHLVPNVFRVSNYENEYIENECVNTTNAQEYCNYEEYDNTRLEHADLYFTNFSQPQCQTMCESLHSFNCRGYTIVPIFSDSNIYSCYLHSEDSKLIGPKLLVDEFGATYYEKARCLNISVSCFGESFMIKYSPEQRFNGKIYAQGYSDVKPCYGDGNNMDPVTLMIPLNSSACGVIEAYSTGVNNRTLKSMFLVIQYNALIQTQGDRLLKIGCVDDNSREIILDTNVNFTDSFPNKGSTVFNTSSILPVVTMRVVDFNTQDPTSDTEIGQELQLIIEIKPGNGPYDIWASNLAASSEKNYNSIVLIDDKGCPTDTSIFPSFNKVVTNTSRSLIAKFQAFKFSTSTIVRFRVMVHFCTMQCPPVRCGELRRGKRETPDRQMDDTINATVYNISGKNRKSNSSFDFVEEIPLDLFLLVRTSKSATDKFVVGDNSRILVAGYDFVTDEVCLDYSLFIGLMIVWVLLQVIILVSCFLLIKRYKKYFHIAYTRQSLDDMQQNFGQGVSPASRRVRWADQ